MSSTILSMAFNAIPKVFTVILSLVFSAVTCIHLLIEWFKHRDSFFTVKEHPKPKVLDGWIHETVRLSNFFTSQEVNLHYVEAGDMDHPLMLMIHGFPEFWYSWRYQIRYFEKNFQYVIFCFFICINADVAYLSMSFFFAVCSVVAIDMRGYNESDKPEGIEHYRKSVLAKDIKELISALNHEQAILVAHDWGGAVAWQVAAEYPEVVAKLVVLNCPHPAAFRQLLHSNFRQLMKSWYMFMFQMPSLPEFLYKSNDYQKLKDIFRSEKTGIKRKENFTDEDEDAWLFSFSKPNAFTGPINYYRASFKLQEAQPSSALIKPNTLIIWGTGDAFLEKRGADISPQYCEKAQVKFIEGASHWVQQDEPNLVNAYIDKFVMETQ
ncbi:unnamed protein product [Anisakis simplex]|uniref:AB hydrolase-1 domain-containing protein n=1 Tax=Anisakis simplex TaxID=6269 RepID=A0A0M3JTM4_ANISI|nr:unnamed protein product [Anisakis simplex]